MKDILGDIVFTSYVKLLFIGWANKNRTLPVIFK